MAASIGMTIIQGINEMVETVNEFPMSEAGSLPDGTGTSIYHRARKFLDRETKRVLAQGWPENTMTNQRRTLGGSGDYSTAAPTQTNPELVVRGAGPDSHRNLVIRYDSGESLNKVYDMDQQSFDLRLGGGGTSRTDVFLDIIHGLDTEANGWGFANLTPELQNVIVDAAKMKFQLRIQGNLDMNTVLQQEALLSDAEAARNRPATAQSYNIAPMAARMRPPKQEG